MSLTGFKKVSEKRKQEENASFSISVGNSPFQEGVKFKVTDYDYEHPEEDGKVKKDAKALPVLITSVGSMFISMIRRNRVTADGTIIRSEGNAVEEINKIISDNSGKSNGEILQTLTDKLKEREIRVTRRDYIAKDKDGRTYAASIVDLNFFTAE